KPNADELKAAPHRLLDIRDPSQAYSAADFRRDALAQMAEITAYQLYWQNFTQFYRQRRFAGGRRPHQKYRLRQARLTYIIHAS
ncbi:hypothetical protein MJH54_34355, partial [Salmonella enterica subsp. enterica serovar Montevideo]|nr:hypothetical protein [Salmonella enterica subsp. enterica serovar Montevideo]